jgi:FG-GAP repeat
MRRDVSLVIAAVVAYVGGTGGLAHGGVSARKSTERTVSPVWLSQVETGIREAEYRVLDAPDGSLVAPNGAQHIRVRFSNDAVRIETLSAASRQWTMSLRLARFGREGSLAGALEVPPVADADRVEYRRGELTEWYVNEARGLEQGFTIARRPAGERTAGPLVLDLRVSGDLHAVFGADGQGIEFVDKSAKGVRPDALLRYGSVRAVDAAGREIESRLRVVDAGLQIEIQDQDADYPLTVDPLMQGPAWQAQGDEDCVFSGGCEDLGFSVASAGDVNADGYADVLIGVPGFNSPGTQQGAAFLYLGSSSGLSTTPAWEAHGGTSGDQFGWSVASAGDVNADTHVDIIIGAISAEVGTNQGEEGIAYVWYGGTPGVGNPTGLGANGSPSNADWHAEGDQTPFGGVGAHLGWSVASAGDVNNDGYDDIIVGVPDGHSTTNQAQEGRALVWLGSSTGVNQGTTGKPGNAKWKAESNQTAAHLGYSVAGAGDVNGDGFDDVIVGAPDYDSGSAVAGWAFLWKGKSTGLSGGTNATPNNADWSNQGAIAANFGKSVAAAGDVNGDGKADVIIGAPEFTGGQSLEGKVFIYLGTTSSLGATAAWTAESDQAGAQFGSSVAGAGDFNHDGFVDVIVGAPYYDGSFQDEGAAFLYSCSNSTPLCEADGLVTGGQAGAEFGYAVAKAGDVNNDAHGDVLIGAPLHDTTINQITHTDAGRAYLYLGNDDVCGPCAEQYCTGADIGCVNLGTCGPQNCCHYQCGVFLPGCTTPECPPNVCGGC